MVRKDFEIRNDLSELEILAADVLKVFRENGLAEELGYDIRLALEEAISNIIKYGYDDQNPHRIRVSIGVNNQEFFLEIEDDGKAFNPLEGPPPNFSLPVEQKPIGGLGIYLLRTLMDEVEYRRNGSKNRLRMTKFNPMK